MTVAEMYRLLELEEGAGPAEVKKAYFRLIRKYPPEQNPEAFQKLRTAYETLKDGPPKEEKTGPDWVKWDNPMVGYMLELADRCEEEEDYDKACDIIGDALKIEPDNVMLHLLMARYQMNGGHPQNAAKYAEFVTKRLPDNREAWMLLSNGYQNRGWYKKALPAFEKAYELGCRDIGFLLERISNMAQNGAMEEAEEQYRQFVEETPCNDKTRMLILEAYYRWGEIISPKPGKISEYLLLFDRFVRKEGKKIEQTLYMSPLMQLAYERIDVIRERSNRQRIRQSVQTLVDRKMFPEDMAADFVGHMLCKSILYNHPDLQPSWSDLATLTEPVKQDDPGLRKYIETDALLCLLTKAERSMDEIPLIRGEYPEIAENYAAFLEAIEKGETETILKKLKWEFDKYSEHYDGSRYEEMYGNSKFNRNERRRSMQEKWDQMIDSIAEVEDPYVREKEKVGRNDPCPCGSGKKFKKCCMGKGIYD